MGRYESNTLRRRMDSNYVAIVGRPLHYVGNGTGRDSYIMYVCW